MEIKGFKQAFHRNVLRHVHIIKDQQSYDVIIAPEPSFLSLLHISPYGFEIFVK